MTRNLICMQISYKSREKKNNNFKVEEVKKKASKYSLQDKIRGPRFNCVEIKGSLREERIQVQQNVGHTGANSHHRDMTQWVEITN